MFQTAGTIWSRINEIGRWLKGIEETGEKTSAEVVHLRREIDIITREVGHGKTVADFQGRKLPWIIHQRQSVTERSGACGERNQQPNGPAVSAVPSIMW